VAASQPPRILSSILPASHLEDLLLANLALLERLGRAACRGSKMTAEDVEDFLSDVKVKLIERDYAALRSFEGRCSMATWLALLVQRQLLDYRARVSGRFRPSAEAQRIGPAVMRLEVLVVRDRKSIEVALEILQHEGNAMTRDEAEKMLAKLPARTIRPVAVPLDGIETEPPAQAIDPAVSREHATVSRMISKTIRDVIRELPTQDQAVLQMLFAAGMSVADIARCLGIGQQVLYRRVRRLCAQFRDELIAAGIDAKRVRDLLESPDADLDLGWNAPSDPATRPSNETRAEHD
jgi:RNA polymerase sigma factor (sigma-70 family)